MQAREVWRATPCSGGRDLGISSESRRLQSPGPEIFTSTPKAKGKGWGMYAVLLERDNSSDALYIRSTPSSVRGRFNERMGRHKDSKQPVLPKYVMSAYDEGYHRRIHRYSLLESAETLSGPRGLSLAPPATTRPGVVLFRTSTARPRAMRRKCSSQSRRESRKRVWRRGCPPQSYRGAVGIS